ncbi:YegS/Rv2252/BmrU family lipid kinase [Cytobacillus sp. FJAT-54145]|uniref:YegS/Rv2252/BmrU family lipid kinase n=1 Tax=Cytobacillus spartinae TaxID=3299023 RepID=A0ABW6KFM4_9BACI
MDVQKAMLIYNGKAGQKDVYDSLKKCVPVLASHIDQLIIMKTKRSLHAKEICEKYGDQVELVIILGGDGTVHECINGLSRLEKRPVVAILPGGTCNDFSRSLQISQDIQEAVEQLVKGEMVSVDAVKVNEDYFINFWGIGLVTETSNHIRESEKAILGRVSYFLSALRTMKDLKPFKYRLQRDHEMEEGKAVMILVTNGSYIGTNPLPFIDISVNDGYAEIVVVNEANVTLLKDIFEIGVLEEKNKDQHIQLFRAKEIYIETEDELDVDMDGEVYLNTPCKLEILHHHFRMLKPSQT